MAFAGVMSALNKYYQDAFQDQVMLNFNPYILISIVQRHYYIVPI